MQAMATQYQQLSFNFAAAEEACKITGGEDEEVRCNIADTGSLISSLTAFLQVWQLFTTTLYTCIRILSVCSRMATKLLRLTADEKKEAKRDGKSLGGE